MATDSSLGATTLYLSFDLLNDSFPSFSNRSHLTPTTKLHSSQVRSDVILQSYSQSTSLSYRNWSLLSYHFHPPFLIHPYNTPNPYTFHFRCVCVCVCVAETFRKAFISRNKCNLSMTNLFIILCVVHALLLITEHNKRGTMASSFDRSALVIRRAISDSSYIM